MASWTGLGRGEYTVERWWRVAVKEGSWQLLVGLSLGLGLGKPILKKCEWHIAVNLDRFITVARKSIQNNREVKCSNADCNEVNNLAQNRIFVFVSL